MQEWSKRQIYEFLTRADDAVWEKIKEQAFAVRRRVFGNRVFLRGLIELTNYCKNDCYYCGIRRSSQEVSRYRLGREEVLACCEEGHRIGYRTFVLQGGEDPHFTDERLCALVRSIKTRFPDSAVTLSMGERSRESYEKLRKAGADRYLLRHETACREHYHKLHPPEMSFSHRMECLAALKELGFQTGAGFMVGSPGQTPEHLTEDLWFIYRFRPQMVGIGPFIPARNTPFAAFPAGSAEQTVRMLALTRILLPNVLLPVTTALATLGQENRFIGLCAGGNVIMPNLSPKEVRKKYMLYDHKACTGSEAAEYHESLKMALEREGFTIDSSRGDYAGPDA